MNDLLVGFLSRLGWASVFLAGAGVLAHVVLRLLRVKSPGVHAGTWWAVLLHGLLLLQVTLTVPWYEPSESVVLANENPIVLMPVKDVNVAAMEPTVQVASVAARPKPVVVAKERPFIFPWPLLIGLVWLGGVLFVLLQSIWGYVAFLRACRSRPCDRRDWTEEWNAVLEEAGVGKPIPIYLGFGVGPALCRHWAGYRLIVPVQIWRGLSSEQRQWVMQHELAHYQRGDVWSLLVARLLALPHWFNPFAWVAIGAIELASEYSCDDMVGQRGPDRTTDYARTLLAIGESVSRPPAWTTAGGGGCLFKRISRVLSTSQAKDSGMKKALILVVFLVATLAAVVRVELVAQEAPRQSPAIDPFETTTSVVTRIRELAKPAPIPFEEIEAIAAEAAAPRRGGTFHRRRPVGPVYAEVAMAYHRNGIPARTVVWAQAALRQDLKPLDRLRMFRYWAEADDLVHEQNNTTPLLPTPMRPVAWGLLEASRFRIPVEGFPESSGSEESRSTLLKHRDELVEHRDALVRLATKGNKELGSEVKRFLLSPGLKGTERTPDWLSEGRAMAYTFRIDPVILMNDLRPVFDAWVGEPGAFADIQQGLKEDKHGPRVDLERELIPYLGQQTTLVTDYHEPILGHGERSLSAIEATDSNQVADVVDRLFVKDSNVSQVSEAGVKIWVSEPNEGQSASYGVCVARGYLFCGDLDLLRETLRRAE